MIVKKRIVYIYSRLKLGVKFMLDIQESMYKDTVFTILSEPYVHESYGLVIDVSFENKDVNNDYPHQLSLIYIFRKKI